MYECAGYCVEMTSKTTWKQLEKRRHELGLKYVDLAKLIGVTPGVINQWKGRGIAARAIPDVARAIGKSVDWLLGKERDEAAYADAATVVSMLRVDPELIKKIDAKISAFWPDLRAEIGEEKYELVRLEIALSRGLDFSAHQIDILRKLAK